MKSNYLARVGVIAAAYAACTLIAPVSYTHLTLPTRDQV